MLYDLNQPGSNTNPAMFYNLAEYAQFVKEQQLKGLNCPVLELQTQIIGSSISNASLSVPSQTIHEKELVEKVRKGEKGEKGEKEKDYKSYNNYGEGNIGTFTKEDKKIEPDAISDNPMDTNWGGIQYSQRTLASGKYDGDMVTKPLYYNMPQNAISLNPTYPGMEPPPPNYVPTDLIGKQIQIQHNKS
jgi:hypothetical protein